MVEFNIILDMYWFALYHIILDYYAKTITLAPLGMPRVAWKAVFYLCPKRVLFFLKDSCFA